MTATESYIKTLESLQPGELTLLRSAAGQGLDHTLDAFDLFTGLWWPLRQKTQHAPRREVAWLIAKLYACHTVPRSDYELAFQLGKCQPRKDPGRERSAKRFDRMLCLPLTHIEPALGWALDLLAAKGMGVNWSKLTDDLSIWERESTRLKWAEQYLDEGRK